MRSVTVTTEYRPKFIPVVFHNLSNYEAHLFIKKMFINNPEERLECIPNNEEKYIVQKGNRSLSYN